MKTTRTTIVTQIQIISISNFLQTIWAVGAGPRRREEGKFCQERAKGRNLRLTLPPTYGGTEKKTNYIG